MASSTFERVTPDIHRPDTNGGGSPRHPLDWARAAGAAELVRREMEACVRRSRRRRALALSGGLALLLVVGAIWRNPAPPAPSVAPITGAVVIAPARQVLPDGSVVE